MDAMKFEKAMDRLEKIVDLLEGEELDLDEALKLYEEGIGLSRLCNKKLHESEKKVEQLVKKARDTFETEPFLEDDAASQGKKKKKKTKSQKRASDDTDDDLFGV